VQRGPVVRADAWLARERQTDTSPALDCHAVWLGTLHEVLRRAQTGRTLPGDIEDEALAAVIVSGTTHVGAGWSGCGACCCRA
jgi:hypothetical protein